METAGKCFEWVKDHLVLDEVNIYLSKTDVAESQESVYESLYDYMSDTVARVAPGSGGVIFTPWLHGNRCPFEDPAGQPECSSTSGWRRARRRCCGGSGGHLLPPALDARCEERKTKTAPVIRFVGGGALSKVTCQMLADITGRTVETVENTKDVGAIGAAMLAAVGSGLFPDLAQAASHVKVNGRYTPNTALKPVYDRNYRVFRQLYASNKKNFALLNRLKEG